MNVRRAPSRDAATVAARRDIYVAADQVGFERPRHRVTDAHASHHARAIVVHPDGVGAQQAPQNVLAFGTAQVERDRPLVAVEVRDLQGVVSAGQTVPPILPRFAGLHDPGHLGDHVGEEHRAEGARDDRRQVDDSEAFGVHGAQRMWNCRVRMSGSPR
jgi:hypothetical protein